MPGFTVEQYRDRLYHEGYIPSALAPLNDLKGHFVEVANPLLTRRMVALARTFPDDLRMYGRAFSRIIDGETRLIPRARSRSTPDMSTHLRGGPTLEAILAELVSPSIERVISREGAVRLVRFVVARRDRHA